MPGLMPQGLRQFIDERGTVWVNAFRESSL